MKHLFIPYELAVIAKEKGCIFDCIVGYNSDYSGELIPLVKSEGIIDGVPSHLYSYMYICAPSYQQITDWFRDNYDLHIRIDFFKNGWIWNWTNLGNWNKSYPDAQEYYKSYYNALNKAIEEAFKLI